MKQGFTLIEVLIFTAIVSLFFVVGATVVVFSLRQMTIAQHKIIATREAETLIAWLESEKEVDWGGTECNGCASDAFTEEVSRVTQNLVNPTICFNNLDWSATSACSANDYSLNQLYKREAKFSYALSSGYISQITVVVTVKWRESGQTHQISSNRVFSVWE